MSNKIMLCMLLVSAISFGGTAWIVYYSPHNPTCEERGGHEVMTGAVAIMAGSVAIPVPYYECEIPKGGQA